MGLSPYTGILTPAGEEKRIGNIVAGDRVREDLSGAALVVADNLNSPGVGMVRVHAGADTILDLTGDQYLLGDSGKIAANRVAPGTILRSATGYAQCHSVEPLMGDYMVYDLVPADTPGGAWIVANGLVVAAGRV